MKLDQSSVGRLSRMDAMRAQAMSIETEQRRQLAINRIDMALLRIEAQEYGFCSSCEEPIDQKRLENDPAIPVCIACAENIQKK